MGCSMKSASMAEEAEQAWKSTLAGGKLAVFKLSVELQKLINAEAFTVDEFAKLRESMRILDEVCGNKTYW